MKLRRKFLAMVLAVCFAISMPLSVVTAAPRTTGPTEVLSTNASGDNGHLRLNQRAKWVDKQKNEAEVTFNLDTDEQRLIVPKNQDIVFVINPKELHRLEKTKESLKESATTLLGNGGDNRLGLVEFGGGATALSDLTNDASSFNGAIETLFLRERTYYGPGLKAAQQMLDARDDKSREAVVIFMADRPTWDPNVTIEVANQLKASKVEIYAVQYLSGSEINPSIKLVTSEEHRVYNADKLDSLSTVYREVIKDVTGTKLYTDMRLDIPVDTDNYTIVSGTSTHGKVDISEGNVVWTSFRYFSGSSAEIKLCLKLKKNSLTGYVNNLKQANLTYTDPTVEGIETLSIEPTVLDRVAYTLKFNGNSNTGGTVPEDMTVVGGTEASLPYNPNGLTKDGEVFTGWSLDDVQQKQTFTMPAEDTTLEAVWGNHEVELNTKTIAPIVPVPMKSEKLESAVEGAYWATKVEFVDYIDPSKSVTDLSAKGDESIGGWMDGTTLYVGCSKGPISAPEDSGRLLCFSRATEINFNDWFVTDQVKHMNGMFMQTPVESLDLSGFNTSNVISMGGMFANTKVKSLDLSNFDTSNAIGMTGMFFQIPSLTSVNLSNFDTSNVFDMRDMFGYCPSLKELDLRNFDTSNVTDMRGMFANSTALKELDLSNFDTSNVTDMRGMFANCTALKELDLRNFDMSKAKVDSILRGASGLENLYVGSEAAKTKIQGSIGFPAALPITVVEPVTTKGRVLLKTISGTPKDTDTSVADSSVIEEKKRETGKASTRGTVDSTLIDGGKIKQGDKVDYEITVKYHATAGSQSNRIKVTNKMPEDMTYLEDSVLAEVDASRIVDGDGGETFGKIENLNVENNVVTFDAVGLSEGAKIRVYYETTATKQDTGVYYEFLNKASGTLQGLGQDSNFVSHHYDIPPKTVYMLTYNYAEGSPSGAPAVPTPRNYAEGEKINIPTPSMPGYVFDGWKENGNLVADSYTMGANNVTLTGSWTPVAVTDTDITAKVTYQFDGDIPAGLTPPPGESYTVGTNSGGNKDIWGIAVDIPTITVPNGYTFDGWTSDNVSEGDITNGRFTLGEESVVIKGTWTKNKYKVIYKYNGDTPAEVPVLPTETTHEWGTAVKTAQKPADTTTANFEGWMSNNNIEADFATGFTMPQEDVTLFGYWTKAAEFKVTYQYDDKKPKPADAPILSNDNGSEGDTKIAYAPRSTVIRDGKGNYGTWTLDKWTSPDLTGDVRAGDIYTMPKKDIVLTGAWTFNADQEYREVKFKIQNGKWADGTIDEIIVPIKLIGGVATLDPGDVPVDMTANTGYGLGEWDVTPDIGADAITGHVTYTYRYKKQGTQTVTFKISGGKWADGTDADKTVKVTVIDGKGTLNTADVPAGMMANTGCETPGFWDTVPDTTANAVTDDVTYTYKYKKQGTEIVTFKITGGNWADGTDADKLVTVNTLDGVGTLNTTDVPSGMTVKTGYEGTGKWDVTPNTNTDAVSGSVTYTYNFKKVESNPPVVPPTPDPDKPDTPNEPEKPDKPDTPNEPEKPDKPSKPDTPDKPETPDDPTDPKTPQTGDAADLVGLIILLGISITGLVAGRHKIKR